MKGKPMRQSTIEAEIMAPNEEVAASIVSKFQDICRTSGVTACIVVEHGDQNDEPTVESQPLLPKTPQKKHHPSNTLIYTTSPAGRVIIDVPATLAMMGRTRNEINNQKWPVGSAEHRLRSSFGRRRALARRRR